MGKPTMVTKYVSDLKTNRVAKYSHIFWISLISEYLFEKTVKQCCRKLDFPQRDDFVEERDQFFAWIANNGSCLLIIDNADETHIADQCLGELSGILGHVLITSRNPKIDYLIPLGMANDQIFHLKVNLWSQDTTRTYIASRSPKLLTAALSQSENESLDRILKFMNGYPLVVEQMCSFLTFIPRGTFSKYEQLLSSNDKRIWDQTPVKGASNYERTLDKTFEIIINHFKETGQHAACIILGAIGCVSNRAIPIQTYLRCYLLEAEINTDVDEVLSTLIHVSLVILDEDSSSVSVHLAIREVIRRVVLYTDYISVPFHELAVSVMSKFFPPLMYTHDVIENGKPLLPHITPLYNVGDQNFSMASLLYEVARLATFMYLLEFAREFYDLSRRTFIEVYGSPFYLGVADSIIGLASVAKMKGDYLNTKKLYNESLEIYLSVLGTK